MLTCRENLLRDWSAKFAVSFKDFSLLNCALTHASYTKENALNYSYEKLEFLGDAVLKIAISEFLFKEYPQYDEGELTHHRALIVSDKILAKFAEKIKLGELILLGESEMRHNGAKKVSILACAFEAILGAIFLDANQESKGLSAASEFILSNFKNEIVYLIENFKFSNPKAALQEYTQGLNNELPIYKTIKEDGRAHDKIFEVEVFYDGKTLGTGTGKRKKDAQQIAAKNALAKLGVIDNSQQDEEIWGKNE